MTSKLLHAVQTDTSYCFLIHTDDSKFDKFGRPDPTYVREFTYGRKNEKGEDIPAKQCLDEAMAVIESEAQPATQPLVI